MLIVWCRSITGRVMLTLLRALPALLRYSRRTRVLGVLMGLRLGGALMECTGQALVALSVMALRRIEANIWKRSYPTQASGPSHCLESYPALSTRHPSLLTGLDVNITISSPAYNNHVKRSKDD